MFPETAERTPGTVHLICGKLCSGKTRYAGKLQALTGAVCLSCDEIEYDLFHHELGERYDAVAADIKRYLHKKAVEIARAGCPVILDWGFWQRAERTFRDRGEKASARSRKEQDRAIRNERKKGQQITWKEALQDKRNLLYNLQEELEELENDNEKILKAQKEVQSISLAEKMLAKAAGNLQSRRGNFLKERTWEIFGELTQGRYQRGIIDENFQIRLDTGDRYAGLHQVSQGTAEQVYFALRMAAGELLCREEELPVILDETFAMYDDKRLCEALEWLHRNRAQVILLTCTRREIEALESLGIPFHQVDLQIGAGIKSSS